MNDAPNGGNATPERPSGRDGRTVLRGRLEQLRAAGRPEGLPAGFEVRSTTVQASTILGAVVIGPLAGMAFARWLAPGSAFGSFVGFLALPMVLGAGYAAWRAIIASLLFRGVYRGLMRALYQIVVRRTKPTAEDVLPDAQRIAWFFTESMRAASVFTHVGIGIGIGAGALMTIVSPNARAIAFVVFFASAALYGRALTHLARDGYLPPPAE